MSTRNRYEDWDSREVQMRGPLQEVGLRVQSEEDNWKYGIADLTQATAGAKKFFKNRIFILLF